MVFPTIRLLGGAQKLELRPILGQQIDPSERALRLYTTGARGVLVEPNPALAAQLRSKRPGDTVVEAGIGVGDAREADYYEIKGNAMLNTFSPEQVAHLQRGKTESVVDRVVTMPLLNINRVIQEHLGRAPDLLSTDVEGLRLGLQHHLRGCATDLSLAVNAASDSVFGVRRRHAARPQALTWWRLGARRRALNASTTEIDPLLRLADGA